MKALTDQCPMPLGKKYRGTPMEKVPAEYLLWMYKNLLNNSRKLNSWEQQVYDYVTENMDVLKMEVKE